MLLPRLLRRLAALPNVPATPAFRPAPRARLARLGAEQLEDRCVPSVAVGPGTLLLASDALWAGGAAASTAGPQGGGDSGSAADPGPAAPAPSGASPASLWSGLLAGGSAGAPSAPAPAAQAADPAAPAPDVAAPAAAPPLTASAWMSMLAGSAPAPVSPNPATSSGGSFVFGAPLASAWDPTQSFSEAPPWVTGGFEITNPFFQALPLAYQEEMYFNFADSYQTFVSNFYGYARSWAAEAQGITDETQLEAFFSQKLDAQFQATRGVLAAAYPGLTDTQYRALMAMNLADGYYVYGTQETPTDSFATLLNFSVGDCGTIAQLTATFCRLQGIEAQVVSISPDFWTPTGEFSGVHAVCQAAGLWLDAQTNIAFQMDPVAIQAVPPDQRLPALLQNGQVYGFYNWYLNPDVRAEQLQRGLDGGAQAFFWHYYLAGLGQGNSVYNYGADWMAPVRGS
jgi:transglutaminase-like putative cysteine protease